MSQIFLLPAGRRSWPGRPALRSAVLFLAVWVCLSGCSKSKTKGPKNSVSGKVTLGGRPVSGTVTFLGADNQQANSPIQPDGKYMIVDPPVGKVRVAVKAAAGMRGGAAPLPGGRLPEMPGMPGGGGQVGVPPPRKYANPENGLTFEVTGEEQTFDIELRP
jgi:hypothetical protein